MEQLTRKDLKNLLEEMPQRKNASAWSRGVLQYAWDLLDTLPDDYVFQFDNLSTLEDALRKLKNKLLNGADSWHDYSYGGLAYIYDGDVANALCTPYEYRITKHGERKPNKNETWLDVQARALFQAYLLIRLSIITYAQRAFNTPAR